MKSIFIFRRDLRTKDNIGLNECVSQSDYFYPIFIFTPEQIGTSNKYRSNNAIQFMCESIMELQKEINLTLFYGDQYIIIKHLINKLNIDAIFTNTDYTPYAIKRDTKLSKLCKDAGINFYTFHDTILYPPNIIKVYQKFTPYYNKAIKINVNKPSNKTIKNDRKIQTKKINMHKFYKENYDVIIKGGRSNGLKIYSRISQFKNYNKTKNILSISTTHLSAYIKFGCLSIREIYYKIKDTLGLKHPLIRQLIWREFYYQLEIAFSDRFGKSLKPKYDKIKWNGKQSTFNIWCDASTGYPIVDACMQELNTTGYLHNRGRLIVSSFLVKNLQHDWRKGEKYFAQQLLDYDPIVNQGNWQWTAGSGADSQPYFRIFNPWLQSKNYDPDCEYIKKWLPELKNVDNKHIHQWDKFYNDYPDVDYPNPIVDYNKTKIETLKMYKQIY